LRELGEQREVGEMGSEGTPKGKVVQLKAATQNIKRVAIAYQPLQKLSDSFQPRS